VANVELIALHMCSHVLLGPMAGKVPLYLPKKFS
jgi:hypothetical protein